MTEIFNKSIVSPTECLEAAQSLANMLLLGNSGRFVTSKVHARIWLPLQRLNVLSDAWSKLLNIWVRRVTKAKVPTNRYYKIPPSSEKKQKKTRKAGERRFCTL